MGLSLRSFKNRLIDQINPVDNGRTFQHPAPTNNQSVLHQALNSGAFHAAQQIARPVSQPIHNIGQAMSAIAPHIPTFSNNSPLRFANNALISPVKTAEGHFGQALQGHNPYHGSVGQQIGQAGQDVVTAGSFLPVGRGAQIAVKGGELLPKVVSGAKLGIKAGGSFGVAQGLSSSLQGKATLPQTLKNVGINTAIGTLGGAALGVAAPALGSGAKAVVKAINDVKLPKARLQSLDQSGKLSLKDILGGSPSDSFHYSNTGGSTRISGKRDAVIKKLNESGHAMIPGKEPDANELKIGKALGMSAKEVAAAKNEHPLEAAHPKLSVDELANLSPKEQMKIASPSNVPLAEAAKNTAKNPFKANLPMVGHNDFGQVIANEQAASEIGKDNTLRLMEQAKKANPEEFKNFWEHANADPGFKEAPKSPQLKAALGAWRTSDNRIHGNSQALGGNTNYLENHGLHPVVFNEDMTNQLLSGADPNKFSGLHNLTRKHPTMAALRAAAEKGGFTVGNDPLSEANHYLSASEHALRRRAIIKGVGEADGANLDKTHNLTLGVGDKNIVPISSNAHNELRGLQRSIPTTNRVVKGARTANVATKSTLLSFGQFHPNNISLMRAAPTLVLPKPSTAFYRNAEGKMKFDPTMSSHPVKAAKGLYATYRPLVPGSGTNFAARVNAKAVEDGMDIKAAKIGAPYNAQLFDSAGSNIAGVGHKLLGRQMLGMHDQAVRAVIGDLEKRGIPLDSAEARTAGKAVNNMMGFVNNEAQKIPPIVSRQLGDWLLARQFTHSKFSQLRTGSTQGGVGGAYARANVAANVVASTAVITGVGYILKQKSDSIRDALIRALTDPAIPTPMQDSKGNTVKLRLPGTDASDVAKLLGIKSVRQADGHLGISWKPSNLPSTVEDFARARLSPLPGIGLKIATNENYAGKPMYDPSAQFGVKAEQAATTALSGLLPIGLQGVPMAKVVEQHLPGSVQDVLNANKPGGNPLVKSLGSSFGVTPTTDQTVGKGKDSARFYGAADETTHGLQSDGAAAVKGYIGSKKNPVTGKYDIAPTVWDTISKAADLLKADSSAQRLGKKSPIDALIEMNQRIASEGGKVDPLWQQSKDKIIAYFQYQSNADPFSPQRGVWYDNNKSWYQPLSDQRSKFFGSLPKGDPNKPSQPVEYPNPTPAVQALKNQYYKITDGKLAYQFTKAHPELQAQFDSEFKYKNDLLKARGYAEYKGYPKAAPQLQTYMDKYNAADKATRKAIRNGNPSQYQKMIAYYDSVDLYNINKEGSRNQLQGQPDQTSKQNKAIQSVAKDIYQNADGTYQIVPAGWMQGLSNGSGSGGSGGSSGRGSRRGGRSGKSANTIAKITGKAANPYKYAVSPNAGGKAQKPKVTVRTQPAAKNKVGVPSPAGSKPKVTLKKSKI